MLLRGTGSAAGKACASGRAAAPSGPKPSPAAAAVPLPRHSRVSAASVGDDNGAAPATTSAIDFEELTDVIRMVHDTDIIELELKSKKYNLSLRKREAVVLEQQSKQMQYAPAPAAYMGPPPPQAPAASSPAPAAAAAAPTPAPTPMTPSPQRIEGIEINSPMSGTFYTAAAPGEPAFCKEGDMVVKGQTVGIIEAMKLMNEIEAEVSGEVVRMLVTNGTPVSPGMPLILIRP